MLSEFLHPNIYALEHSTENNEQSLSPSRGISGQTDIVDT